MNGSLSFAAVAVAALVLTALFGLARVMPSTRWIAYGLALLLLVAMLWNVVAMLTASRPR